MCNVLLDVLCDMSFIYLHVDVYLQMYICMILSECNLQYICMCTYTFYINVM